MKFIRGRITTESLLIGLLIAFFLSLLTACGNGSGSGSGGGGIGTGSIAFKLRIQDSLAYAASGAKIADSNPFDNTPLLAQTHGDGIDCEFHQIYEIVACIYNEAGVEVAWGGPWPCDWHSGTIQAVPVEESLTLKLWATEICSGEKTYYGEKGGPGDPIIVSPGEKKDVGQIVLEPISNPWQLSIIDNTIACRDNFHAENFATSIAISPKDDSVHIGYYDCSRNEVRYATNASGSWETEPVPKTADEYQIGYTSIALDSDGSPHISYIGDYCRDGCYALYYATRNESGLWNSETAYDYYPQVSRNTSIAVRSDATTKVADITCIIGNDYSGFSILYVSCSESGCTSEELEPGNYASLALDSKKFAHIGYSERRDGAMNIRYKTNIPSGEWQDADTADTYITEGGSARTAIGLDSNDTVHISYCDVMTSDLNYFSGVLQDWNESETVQNTGHGCDHHSIAVDSPGKVHMSYYAGGEFKYATGYSGCWIIHSVDKSGDVGQYNSIAVDSNDNVHISYYDAANGVLKYATRSIQKR